MGAMRRGTPAGAVAGVLREWFGIELLAGAGVDERGVPALIGELRRVRDQLPRILRDEFRCSGDARSSGQVIVAGGGSVTYVVPLGASNPRVQLTTGNEVQLQEELLDQFVLNTLLNGLRMEAPVCAELRFASGAEAERFLDQLDHHGDWVNVFLDRVVFRFFAADETIVQSCSHDKVFVFGRTRPDVDTTLLASGGVWTWTRLDAIYEPETDVRRGGSPQTVAAATAVRSGEPLDVCFVDRSPAEAIEHFLQSWYGLTLPEIATATEPILLHRVRVLNRSARIIGAHNQLIDPEGDADIGNRGPRWFLAENQWVWRAGYHEGEENPQVVVEESGLLETSPWRHLDNFLLHEVVSEAMRGAPVHASTSRVDVQQARAAMHEHFTRILGYPALIDDNQIAGIWSDGQILVSCTSDRDTASLKVGAHDRKHIAESSMRTIGGWTWFYD